MIDVKTIKLANKLFGAIKECAYSNYAKKGKDGIKPQLDFSTLECCAHETNEHLLKFSINTKDGRRISFNADVRKEPFRTVVKELMND